MCIGGLTILKWRPWLMRKILTGQKHASDFVNAEAAKNEESSFNHARRRTAWADIIRQLRPWSLEDKKVSWNTQKPRRENRQRH
jgi:hypothetical protein